MRLRLRASSYTINVESAGFKRSIRRGVTLEVGQVAVLDFTLEVGQVTEAVEVTQKHLCCAPSRRSWVT